MYEFTIMKQKTDKLALADSQEWEKKQHIAPF